MRPDDAHSTSHQRSATAVLLITNPQCCTTCQRARCDLVQPLANGRPCTHAHEHEEPAAQLPALPAILAAQAAGLRTALPKGWHVLAAVHSGTPSIADALSLVESEGVERLVVIPMHPQFSASLGGGELDELYACLRRLRLDLHVEVRSSWYDDAAFIDATAQRLHDFAAAHSLSPRNSLLLFGARMPQKDSARYRDQVRTTAELVRRRLGWPESLCTVVCGDLGPCSQGQELLAESIEATDPRGTRAVLACSITDLTQRPCEHTVAQAAIRAAVGTRTVHLCPAPNASPEFIRALTQLARRARRSAFDLPEPAEPLFPRIDIAAAVERELDSLFMIGVEMPGPLAAGCGPALRFTTPEEFRAVKRPHLETIELLRHAARCTDVRECWAWNTCTRFELYGWLPHDAPPHAREATIARLRHIAFEGANPAHTNILTDRAARLHMLRTAAGLNSHLIGDREVLDQLESSRRAAEHAGTAGPLSGDLIDDTVETITILREQTPWRSFENRYCATALTHLYPRLETAISSGRILVIGGSTTSCSMLEALVSRFNVPRDRLHLTYRGRRKGALTRRLHLAVGNENVTIVDSYGDPLVLSQMAEADLVILGIDQRDPITRDRDIAAARGHARPLTILDFNTFGSILHTGSERGLTLITAADVEECIQRFNADAMSAPGFAGALEAAESFLASHAGAATPPDYAAAHPPAKSPRQPAEVHA